MPAVYASGQAANDNCIKAEFLCANVTVPGTNVGASALTCGGCQDDFWGCILPHNTIWYKFITNAIGGAVTIDLTNISYVVEAGRAQNIEIAVYSFTSECIPSTYGVASNCNDVGGATSFTEVSNILLPNTEYYIVIDGVQIGAGITLPGEATFDITISGAAIDRPNPSVALTASAVNICKGDLVTFSTSKTDCVFDSTYAWTINGVLVATTNVDTFQTNAIQDQDYVAVFTICDTICQIANVSDSIQFSVLELIVDAGSDVEIVQGESTILTGFGQGQIIDWIPGSSLSNPNVLNPVATPIQTTTYFLTITDTINGCTDYDSVTVTVVPNLKIPDTFTPNGDGINDTWEIITIEEYPNCEIIIYDRWGQVVFKTIGYPQSKWWDGKSKGGKDLTPGAFFYYIDLKSPAHPDPYRGSLNLVR